MTGSLASDGVPASAISIRRFGEAHLLVPFRAGARKPQIPRIGFIAD
jgi:hypothetical protein